MAHVVEFGMHELPGLDGGAGGYVFGDEWLDLLGHFGVFAVDVFNEKGHHFEAFIDGTAAIEVFDGEGDAPEGIGLRLGDGAHDAEFGQDVFSELCHDHVQVLCDEAGHVLRAYPDAGPIAFARPCVERGAADAEDLCDLCLAEICLEVQVLCLLVLFCFHKQKIPPAPEGEYVRAIFSAS